MQTFFLILLVSYFARGFQIYKTDGILPGGSPHGWEAAAGFSRGILVVLLADWAVGTPVSKVLVSVGLTVGYMWFPRRAWDPYGLVGAVIGVMALMVPDVLIGMLALWSLWYLLTKNWRRSVLGSAVLIPFLMLLLDKTDIYVIFGTYLATIIVYGFFDEVEAAWYTLRGKPVPAQLATVKYRRVMVRALFVCLVLAIVTLTLFNRYVYRGFGMQVDVFRRGTPDFKVVALTFDDGPDIRYTPQILDILKKYDAKATFFLVGKHVEEHPQIARRIVQEGHEVGNHTYSHYNMIKASPARQVEELTRAEAVIKNATGERTSLFRPPRGLYDANLQGSLHDRGYSLALWSVTSGDWLEISSRDIVNNILKRAGPGDVLLFHDSGNLISGGGGNRLNTVQALPHILEELKREGYTFVTMTQLLIISGLTGGE